MLDKLLIREKKTQTAKPAFTVINFREESENAVSVELK
jgi:hypothetical protein